MQDLMTEQRLCKKCGMPLSMYNPSDECFSHPPELPDYTAPTGFEKAQQAAAAAKVVSENHHVSVDNTPIVQQPEKKEESMKKGNGESKPKRKYTRRVKPGPESPEKSVATPPKDPIISTLTSQLEEHLVKARAIYNALVTLRELGVEFEFPEVELP